tara:strand:+ start:1018 stop:1728 length:711 start_codon:yes stop_codon:yes gene_type:complete
MKLKKILSENQELNFTPKQKRAFLESISKFNEYGQSIYRTSKLKEAVSEIAGLVDMASKVAVNETGDWFDNVSVKRDMKGLSESMSVFEKTADEMGALQQRLESLYEDMGHKLGKYYEIAEKIDNIDDKEAAMDFKDLPDKDIDNDGDVDDSDSYLHHKLGNVAKRVENRMSKLAGIEEAAPKMKKEPYDKERDDAALKLIRFSNMVKMEQPGVYSRNKTKIAKAMKAIEDLRFLR